MHNPVSCCRAALFGRRGRSIFLTAPGPQGWSERFVGSVLNVLVTKGLNMAKRGSSASLAAVSVEALQSELARRAKAAGKLYALRDRALAKVAEIEAKIRAAGAPLDSARPAAASAGSAPAVGVARRGPGRPKGSKTRRGRGGNAMSLVSSLQALLTGKSMGVNEMTKAVQEAGYKSNSKTFRTIVNQALIKHTDKFKKVSRGVYTAK